MSNFRWVMFPHGQRREIARWCWAVFALVFSLAVYATGESISPSELTERLKAANRPLVVDVRSATEYQQGHIAGAINIAHDEVADRWSETNTKSGDEVVLYCGTGRRAGLAQKTLDSLGYVNTRSLKGGLDAWKEAGLPLVAEPIPAAQQETGASR